MDGAFGLGPAHVDEGLAVGNHLAGCDEEGSKFRFSCRRHNKFDDLGNGKDSSVESWKGVIFGEIDMCSCAAAGLGFVEKSCIGVSTKDHVTSPVDDAIIGIRGHIVK